VIRCDAVLDNAYAEGFGAKYPGGGGRERDELSFAWTEAHRRFLRKRSRAGRDVGILLPLGSRLRDGDLLFADQSLLMIARLVPAPLLAVTCHQPRRLAELAHELGDEHRPIEIRDDGRTLLLPDEDLLRAWLCRRGFEFEAIEGLFNPLSHVGVSPSYAYQVGPVAPRQVNQPARRSFSMFGKTLNGIVFVAVALLGQVGCQNSDPTGRQTAASPERAVVVTGGSVTVFVPSADPENPMTLC
jgi:urease accessory protein